MLKLCDVNLLVKYLSCGVNAEYFTPCKYLDLYSSKVGGRLALHLQKGKFDFYAGGQLSLVSDQYHFMNFNSTASSVYNPYGYGTQIGSFGGNVNYKDEKYRSVLFEPFVGVRYYPVKNIGIQIEGSQRKTAMGFVVKF